MKVRDLIDKIKPKPVVSDEGMLKVTFNRKFIHAIHAALKLQQNQIDQLNKRLTAYENASIQKNKNKD